MPLIIGFSVDDVREEADPDPWVVRDDFAGEVNEDDMADDAASYAAAASEAQSAGDLSATAAEQGSDAAQYAGQDLIDRAQQDELTSQDLGNNGETMDRVVTNVLRGIATAQDTLDDIDMRIDGDGDMGLTWMVENYSEQAEESHESFVDYLAEVNSQQPAGSGDTSSPVLDEALRNNAPVQTTPPVLIYGDNQYSASGSPGAWTVPGSLKEEIRDSYLKVAVAGVEAAGADVKESIEQYRHTMSQLAVELDADGYDVADSQLDYWRTEEMAEYNGQKLEEELQKDNPNAADLYQYTLGLNRALDQIYNPDGTVRDDFDPESSSADEYVNTIMSQLSEEALFTLGELDSTTSDFDIPSTDGRLSMPEQIAAAQRAVSNGIIATMDPAAGGIDPADIVFDDDGRVDTQNSPPLPPGVATYVYDLPDAVGDTSGSDMQTLMDDYGRFGNLLENSTVTPGYGFSQDLADSAVEVQRIVSNNNDLANGTDGAFVTTGNTPIVVENSGSGDLLSIAARNEQATADQIAERGRDDDDLFVETLLFSDWHDDRGAAEYIHAGTILPDDMNPTDPNAGNFVEAAYNVLSTAGDTSGGLHTPEIRDGNDLLKGTIGDTMVHHMHLIVRDESTESGFIDNGEGYGGEIFGEEYRFEFNLSNEERAGLFQTLLGADDPVRDYFNEEVSKWQYRTASNAFDDSHPAERGDSIPAVAQVSGYMDGAVLTLADQGTIDPNNARISTIVGIATAGIGGGVPGTVLSTATSEFARHTLPEYDFLDTNKDLREDLEDNGTLGFRHIVAQAAIDNDVDGMGDVDLQAPVDINGEHNISSTVSDASQQLQRLEDGHDYLPDGASSLSEEYEKARNRDDSGS